MAELVLHLPGGQNFDCPQSKVFVGTVRVSGLPAHLQSQRPAYTGLQEPRMDSAISVASEGSGLRLPFWDAAPIGPHFRLQMMGPHIPGSGTGAEWLHISECPDTSDQLFSSLQYHQSQIPPSDRINANVSLRNPIHPHFAIQSSALYSSICDPFTI